MTQLDLVKPQKKSLRNHRSSIKQLPKFRPATSSLAIPSRLPFQPSSLPHQRPIQLLCCHEPAGSFLNFQFLCVCVCLIVILQRRLILLECLCLLFCLALVWRMVSDQMMVLARSFIERIPRLLAPPKKKREKLVASEKVLLFIKQTVVYIVQQPYMSWRRRRG